MKSIIYKILFINVLLLGGLVMRLKAQEMPLVIIASNKGVPSELTLRQLKSILKGEKLRWKDGTKITLALMKTSTPLGMATCQRLYGMSPNELNKFFLAIVFQGKGEAPTFFNVVADLQTFISQTPGAIGVIEPTPANKEKVILINGKESI